MDITVVYPAYNEAESIRDTIARSLEALRCLFASFEILIVDDAGTDGTGRIADELAEQHPEIRVIHHERNMGCGRSVWEGLQNARGSLVIHNAMDYPLDLRDLVRMLPLLNEADIVVAIRDAYAGYTAYRRLTSAVNRFLLHLLFDVRLKDYNFTQLYRREVLASVRSVGRSTAFLTPEILIRARDLGYRIRDVEIRYHPRGHGEATSGKPRVIFETLCDMFRFWLIRGRMRRAVRSVPAG